MAKRKRNSAFWSRLSIGFIFVIAVIYTSYHLTSFFTREDIRTIVSGVTSESVTVGGDGYVFRDEKVLYSTNGGAVDYFVSDGQKVSAGQALANVYAKETSEDLRGVIVMIDEQIELLEQCSGSNISSVDLSELKKEADDTYFNLTRLLASGEAGELDYQIEKMMLVLSKINAVSDGDASALELLDTLRAERDKFFSGECEQMYSTQSGYFYSAVDGYETSFSIDAANSIDGDSFYSLIQINDNESVLHMSGAYGKLADDSNWKFVLPLDPDEAEGFFEGQEYNVNFPENNNTTFSMLLEKKVLAYEQKSVLMVFSCNKLPDNFDFERCMTAQVERSSVSGIYVPYSAVHKVDGVTGVYVLRGSVAHFRRIDIIYKGADYFLVAERDDSDGRYYYLGSNELIITNGKNLFDGRIVE